MKIGVLAIQGAVSEHLQHLRKCNVESVPVKDRQTINEVSGLIIPGGESTTIGKLVKQFGLDTDIKERAAAGSLAVFGTCAGMILMAKEISDGLQNQFSLELIDIKVRRNAFGRQKESFETELNFNGFDRPLTTVFIRGPIVEKTGPGVEILATLPEGIVAVRQGNLLGTAFHPELTDDLRAHQLFVDICRKL